MRSNLSKEAFKKRLEEQTEKEKDFFFFTSYQSSGKIFCGTYDDTSFDLTKNTFWSHIKAMRIKGQFETADHRTTEVTYEIGLSKWARLFSYIAGGLTVTGLNFLFFFFSDNVNIATALTLNGFLMFAALWSFIINWIARKIVTQRFEDEFEIEEEDEWEKLAGSISK